MEFQQRVTPESVEVRLAGRLEFTDHDQLREVVALLEGGSAQTFIVDLSALEFIDSAGLGMLLIIQEEAEQRNTTFIVRGPQGDVKRSIDLARIGEIITIEP